MSTIIEAAAAVNPARLTACPRCNGEGRVKFTRPGGWLIEPCNVCGTTGVVDPETAETVRTLQRHADVMGMAVDAPCCDAEVEPCVECSEADVEPYVPTEADEAWYRGLCRETDGRLWEERIEAGPTFAERVYAIANEMGDDPDPVRSWVGKAHVAKLADLIRHLDATSPESFEDRRQAMLDCVEWSKH